MKIINILIFVAAFILVTGGLMFLNSIYADIFSFDFTSISGSGSVSSASTISKNDPTVELNKQINKKAEPIEKDSAEVIVQNDTAVTPVQPLTVKPQVIPVKSAEAPSYSKQAPKADILIRNNNKADVDTIYQKWVKQTAKLYESMDPKKAARIIGTF